MKCTSPTKLAVLIVFLLSFHRQLLAQEGGRPASPSNVKEFVNEYGKYNADRTLRLEFIEHSGDETILYITYTGTSNVGSFTALYLNNFRIVDKKTNAEYRPLNTDKIPTSDNTKFYLYNSNEKIPLEIRFKRLPAYVTNIDILEAAGSSSATYNFTFRNISIDPTDDVSDDAYWDLIGWQGYYTTFYTYEDVTIDLWVDNIYVGKIDRYFKDRNYKPSCGEYGTVMIGFASGTTRKMSASNPSKTSTWNFEFTPKFSTDNCSFKYFTLKN